MSLFFILAVFTNLIADAVKEHVLAIQTQMTYELATGKLELKWKKIPNPHTLKAQMSEKLNWKKKKTGSKIGSSLHNAMSENRSYVKPEH